MNDRLDEIKERIQKLSGEIQSPHDFAVQSILQLIHEELSYLRDQNAHAKTAAAEFARLMP